MTRPPRTDLSSSDAAASNHVQRWARGLGNAAAHTNKVGGAIMRAAGDELLARGKIRPDWMRSWSLGALTQLKRLENVVSIDALLPATGVSSLARNQRADIKIIEYQLMPNGLIAFVAVGMHASKRGLVLTQQMLPLQVRLHSLVRALTRSALTPHAALVEFAKAIPLSMAITAAQRAERQLLLPVEYGFLIASPTIELGAEKNDAVTIHKYESGGISSVDVQNHGFLGSPRQWMSAVTYADWETGNGRQDALRGMIVNWVARHRATIRSAFDAHAFPRGEQDAAWVPFTKTAEQEAMASDVLAMATTKEWRHYSQPLPTVPAQADKVEIVLVSSAGIPTQDTPPRKFNFSINS